MIVRNVALWVGREELETRFAREQPGSQGVQVRLVLVFRDTTGFIVSPE
jgi:hypothetical protein